MELPEALGHTPLRVDGTTVLTSHWAPLQTNSSKVRFYLDRINLANAAAPQVLTPVNVPGSLVSFNGATGRLLTVDYKRLPTELLTFEQCSAKYGYTAVFNSLDPNNYDYQTPGNCTGVERSFKLLNVAGSAASLLDTHPIEDGAYFSGVLIGDDRVFAYQLKGGYWYDEEGDGSGSGSGPTYGILVLSGIDSGNLESELVEDDASVTGIPMAAVGKRLIVSSYNPPGLSLLDATDMSAISVDRKADLNGYLSDVDVSGGLALCSLGQFGMQVVDLNQ